MEYVKLFGVIIALSPYPLVNKQKGGAAMLVVFFRTVILYCVVIFGVRLMGKRQLGELSPSELVITILISNIATLPIEEINTPLFTGLLPILSLVCFEIIISVINMRFKKLRQFFSGKPVIIISDGVLDQSKLKELRFSVDDLTAQLRSNGIFDIREVDFAVVETNGKISIYQKFAARPLTPKALKLPDDPSDNSPQLPIVTDGRVNDENLSACGKDLQWLSGMLASHRLKREDVLLMTSSRMGDVCIVKKDAPE